jgi:enterochelin esterase-like enzyme
MEAKLSKWVRIFLACLAALWLGACGGGSGGGGASGGAPGAAPAPAIPAGTIEHVSLPSAALGRTMAAAVYLPPGYSPARRYPVLYLFYGYGGYPDAYFDAGLAINRTADKLIAANAIEPMLIVAPNYDNSFAVNAAPGQVSGSGVSVGAYEDYLAGELPPFIDARFSTDARRERRYVGGISMGGFAALHLGLRHPALFSKIGAHSAALWDYSASDQFTGQRDWLYATPNLRAQRDPLLLAKAASLDGLAFYLDAGNGDLLRQQDEALAEILQGRGANVEFIVGRGGHDAAYWRSQLENYLRFYSKRPDS